MKNKIKIMIIACICNILLLGAPKSVFGAGTLSIAVSSGNVSAGDEVTLTVYANDEANTDITADMKVTYDAAKLQYVSSSASATAASGTVTVTGSTVSLKFKAIGSGDAYVKAESGSLTAAGTHIMVSGTAGTSGTTDTDDTTDDGDKVKSGDNSLSSLKISAGTLSPAFKSSVTEYKATVGSDVDEITVTPVTSNSKATVESITGNTNLKEGSNVITVLVKAENGTKASYKITVTKSETVTTTANQKEEVSETDTKEDATTATETGENASGDALVIDGINYKISEDFTDEEIPEDFKRADFEYKGVPYQGVVFNHGHMGMFYLVNDAQEGKFFVYDADRDGFYPYVRLTNGDHYIVLMVVANGAIPPSNYEKTTLTIDESVTIPAYQYTGGEEAEIINFELAEGEEAVGGRSDFYIFYAMDDTGVAGWYQYDLTQGTYQRLNQEGWASEEEGKNYDTLVESYNELSERYKSTKTSDRRIIAVLIFVSVVFLIIIINLILKVRELISDRDEDEEEEEEKEEKVRPVRRARKEKKTYRAMETKKDTKRFYDEDDEIDGFEEEPSILGGSLRRKDSPVKVQRPESRKPEISRTENAVRDEDDDIEFLDLNDL